LTNLNIGKENIFLKSEHKMKPCRVCKEEKELEYFYSDSSRSDGYSNRCKECSRIAKANQRKRRRNSFQEIVVPVSTSKKLDREERLRRMAAESAYL